ncbi:contractile injection system protein, VgrG/Pvc8 family [Pseudomonas sp. 3A(2025)]
MQPTFRIVADGTDITTLINDRLLYLRTLDKPGMESDVFELYLDNRDQAVALPPRGASVEIFMGYAGAPLARLGRYIVDSIVFKGPPDTMEIRGKASDMRGSGKTTRSGAWEGVPLASIVGDIASRNGWEPVCNVQTRVARIDQLNESDFNFITRLGRLYDCTAKVADGKLLVMPRQGGTTASGQQLDKVVIRRTDVSQWSFRLSDRSTQKSVRSQYQDKQTGQLELIELANHDAPDTLPPVHTDRHLYPDKITAEQAARARLAALNRATADVNLVMPGRTDLFAERAVDVQGFKVGLDGDYQVQSVEQKYTRDGWTTTLECNGGKEGKAKAEGKKQQPEPQKVAQR